MSDCRFGVSPVNYPDPDPGLLLMRKAKSLISCVELKIRVFAVHFESFAVPRLNSIKMKKSVPLLLRLITLLRAVRATRGK